MKLFYVTIYHLPNQQAHAVQIFNTCAALAQEGAQVSCLAKHKGLKRGTEAAPGDWPLPPTDYFGVAPHFRLVRPPRVWGSMVQRQSSQERFLGECSRYAARSTLPPNVVFTRHASVALHFARQKVPVALEAHDLDIVNEAAMQELMRGFPQGEATFWGVVAISQVLADGLETAGVPAAQLLVAHDGIDPARFAHPLEPSVARALLRERHPDNAELLRPTRPVVGYCGHFYEGRGLEMLLECARRRPEWTLLLVGGFENDVNRCRHIAEREHMRNVIFTGYVPNPELAPYLWACDVLTMPYEHERPQSRFMSPMKMFEYMATGHPIVTADWPQIREVLHEGRNALFHARGDLDALEIALDRLLRDPALRTQLSEAARRDVENYTWQARARRILNWLGQNLAANPVPNIR